MLDSFASAGPMKGILEYASTGSRFRIFLSKGSALIGLALKGVRSPVPSRTNIGQDGSKQAGKLLPNNFVWLNTQSLGCSAHFLTLVHPAQKRYAVRR